MFSIATITTLLAFVSLTLAESSTIRVSTTTVTQCSTSYGKKSKTPVPTIITTTTRYPTACYGVSTVTPTRTITPPPKTTSSTTTVGTVLTTTNMAITDVFSTTSTAFTTVTSTVVTTSTSTSTSSFTEFATETATETVPTSPGFLPAASTTPTAYPDPPAGRRFMPRAKEDASPNVKRGGLDWDIFNLFKYPQSVKCVKTVKVLTTTIFLRTATTTKTTTLVPATVVVQVTTTTTSVSTVVPTQVTVTSSFSTTSTISTVATDTVTLATTVSSTESITVTSTSSLYAACTGANLYGPMVPGGFIVRTGRSSEPIDVQFGGASTAYDCCVLCLNSTPNSCRAAYFTSGGQCVRNLGSPCNGQASGPAAYIVGPSDSLGTFVVSNGNCGYLYQQV